MALRPRRREQPRLRGAESTDAEAITAVFLASRAAAMPYLPRIHSDEQTRAWIEGVVLPGSSVWVAEVGEPPRIVGFAALDGTVLDHFYLSPDARGRGIGSALLAAVKEASPEELSLHVFQRNLAARAFYERHGFVAGELDDGSRNEENEPDLTYRWSAATDATGSEPTVRPGSDGTTPGEGDAECRATTGGSRA